MPFLYSHMIRNVYQGDQGLLKSQNLKRENLYIGAAVAAVAYQHHLLSAVSGKLFRKGLFNSPKQTVPNNSRQLTIS